MKRKLLLALLAATSLNLYSNDHLSSGDKGNGGSFCPIGADKQMVLCDYLYEDGDFKLPYAKDQYLTLEKDLPDLFTNFKIINHLFEIRTNRLLKLINLSDFIFVNVDKFAGVDRSLLDHKNEVQVAFSYSIVDFDFKTKKELNYNVVEIDLTGSAWNNASPIDQAIMVVHEILHLQYNLTHREIYPITSGLKTAMELYDEQKRGSRRALTADQMRSITLFDDMLLRLVNKRHLSVFALSVGKNACQAFNRIKDCAYNETNEYLFITNKKILAERGGGIILSSNQSFAQNAKFVGIGAIVENGYREPDTILDKIEVLDGHLNTQEYLKGLEKRKWYRGALTAAITSQTQNEREFTGGEISLHADLLNDCDLYNNDGVCKSEMLSFPDVKGTIGFSGKKTYWGIGGEFVSYSRIFESPILRLKSSFSGVGADMSYFEGETMTHFQLLSAGFLLEERRKPFSLYTGLNTVLAEKYGPQLDGGYDNVQLLPLTYTLGVKGKIKRVSYNASMTKRLNLDILSSGAIDETTTNFQLTYKEWLLLRLEHESLRVPLAPKTYERKKLKANVGFHF